MDDYKRNKKEKRLAENGPSSARDTQISEDEHDSEDDVTEE